MKHPKFPDTHYYTFEMTVGINSVLSLSPGDISTLCIDGLFALDDAGKLFPGVTVPEDRLQLLGINPMGYQRLGEQQKFSGAFQDAIAATEELPKAKRELRQRLDTAVDALRSVIPHERMLMAKLHGLMDKCDHAAALMNEDRRMAEALMAAAEAITAGVKAALKPVL